MDTRIYVITHKKVDISMIKELPEYRVVQAGNNMDSDLGYMRVNTADNIAEWNYYYSDLIAHYWLWKNISCDIIGFSHYHRFFVIGENVITKAQVEQILNQYEIIVPQNYCVDTTVSAQWYHYHESEDLELIKQSIIKLYPSQFNEFLTLLASRGFHPFNLFICKKQLFDEYCAWVFPILEDMRPKVDFGKYKADEWKRIGGFAAERLFNLWLRIKGLKTFEAYIKDYGKDTFIV